jgi:hypothetical protein
VATLTENGQLVDALRIALSQTEGLDSTPAILRRVLDEDAWRDRLEHRIDGRYTFETFEEFVEAKPLDGLGMHVADIEAILKVRDEHDVLRRVREACKAQGRRNIASNRRKVHRGGSSRDTTLARLHDQYPELYRRVLDGVMSANAAAIQAGFRKPTASVPIDSAENAIDALLRRFGRDDLRRALDQASLRKASSHTRAEVDA